MNRRKFIGIISLGAVGAGAASYIGLKDFNSLAREIIEKDTDDLKINPSEIDNFLAAAKKNNIWGRFTFSKKEFIKMHYYLDNPLFKMPYHTKYKQYRSDIVGMFLLSTNFFENKMNDKYPIQYIALYNPYLRPCSNPFSFLYYN